MELKRLTLPLTEADILSLRAGDCVLLSGVVCTARDAAHKRLVEALDRGADLPIALNNAAIYYCGPAPAPEGWVIGPAGPTTSYRMDAYTPRLIGEGLKVMIGKGQRSKEVMDAIRTHGCVYFAAVGGAAALLSKHITACETVAYEDLGAEAIRRLTLSDFPVAVAADCKGNSIYKN
ncbi:MAG: Fe-S-containing hydro-lyase [Clostridiales bacterium]|nr:Fe-S-containing hydro-lyase [Clostridiales bacterium]